MVSLENKTDYSEDGIKIPYMFTNIPEIFGNNSKKIFKMLKSLILPHFIKRKI